MKPESFILPAALVLRVIVTSVHPGEAQAFNDRPTVNHSVDPGTPESRENLLDTLLLKFKNRAQLFSDGAVTVYEIPGVGCTVKLSVFTRYSRVFGQLIPTAERENDAFAAPLEKTDFEIRGYEDGFQDTGDGLTWSGRFAVGASPIFSSGVTPHDVKNYQDISFQKNAGALTEVIVREFTNGDTTPRLVGEAHCRILQN